MNCQVIAKINLIRIKPFYITQQNRLKNQNQNVFLKNAGDEIYELVISDNNDDN